LEAFEKKVRTAVREESYVELEKYFDFLAIFVQKKFDRTWHTTLEPTRFNAFYDKLQTIITFTVCTRLFEKLKGA